jgi:tetratricopeptide (TPR) repeat protein
LSPAEKEGALAVWCEREVRVLFSIGNCFVLLKEFQLALQIYVQILKKDPHNVALMSSIGRLELYVGNIQHAHSWFLRVSETLGAEAAVGHPCVLMNQGFMAVGKGAYDAASKAFKAAAEAQSMAGKTAAQNNDAVCQVYSGNLLQGLSTLEGVVRGSSVAHADLLFNVCSMYEVESSRSAAKKKDLVALAAARGRDDFNVDYLKLELR